PRAARDTASCSVFPFHSSPPPRVLLSFPTRRSSDLVSMRRVYSHLFNHAVLQFLPNFSLQPIKLAYVVFVYVVRDHDHEVPAERPAYALRDQKGTCFDPRSGGID